MAMPRNAARTISKIGESFRFLKYRYRSIAAARPAVISSVRISAGQPWDIGKQR